MRTVSMVCASARRRRNLRVRPSLLAVSATSSGMSMGSREELPSSQRRSGGRKAGCLERSGAPARERGRPTRGGWTGEGAAISASGAGDEAEQATDEPDDRTLDNDLHEDIAGLGADSAPHADFPDALGDAGEHDVHDADAADEEGDAGDEPAAHAGLVDILLDGVEH